MDLPFWTAIYAKFGAGYPRVSLIIVALIGALVFGGVWSAIGDQYVDFIARQARSEELAKNAAQQAGSSKQAAVSPDSSSVKYVQETLQQITKPFSDLTSIEAEKIVSARYYGKQFRIKLPVSDVYERGANSWAVRLRAEFPGPGVVLVFDKKDSGQLTALRIGQTVEAEGKITVVESTRVVLSECTILSVGPLPK